MRTNIVFLLRHSNKEVTKHEYLKIKTMFTKPDVWLLPSPAYHFWKYLIEHTALS